MHLLEWIKKRYRIILIGATLAAVVLVAVFGMIRLSETSSAVDPGRFPVRINEVLTSNGSYANADGVCCDFIELYNDSARKVTLDGYQLSDRKSGERYVIPEDTVMELTVTKPGEQPVTTNIKVTRQDIELFESFRNMR